MNNLDDLFVEALLNDKATFKSKEMELSISLSKNPKRFNIGVSKRTGNYEGVGCCVNSLQEVKSYIRSHWLRISGKPLPERNPEERAWYIKLRNGKKYPIGIFKDKPKLQLCDDCYALKLPYGKYPELDWDRDEQNPDIMYIPKHAVFDITDLGEH